MRQRQVSFVGLTILAGLTILVLLLWREWHFSSILLLALGMLSLVIALVIMGSGTFSTADGFERWWSLRGALAWLSAMVCGLGIVWFIGYFRGVAPSSEGLSQEFIGFSLAYIIGFIFYRIYRLISK